MLENKLTVQDIKIYEDERGYLSSLWNIDDGHLIEDRISVSKKGVIRGFHDDSYTGTLCFCLHGILKLITWDIKQQKKFEIILSENSNKRVYIPPWFLNAHQCISEKCVLLYKWSHKYSGPDRQYSVRYDDPTINAVWPILPPILSKRDRNAKFLTEIKFKE